VTPVVADDVDPLLGEVVVELLNLLLRDLDLFERGRDLVELQIAPLVTIRDKRT